MTATDRRNLTSLIRRAVKIDSDREWVAIYAAERYFGLIVCGSYMPQVRALVAETV